MGNSDSKSESSDLTESLIKNPLLTDKELINQKLIYEVQKENPNIEIITKLLKYGADTSYKDKNGNTILKIALMNYNKNNNEDNKYILNLLQQGNLPPPPPLPIPIPPTIFEKGGKKRNRKTKKNKRKGKSSKRRI